MSDFRSERDFAKMELQFPQLKLATAAEFMALWRKEMSVVTVRLPEDQHQRLKAMAQARGISLNKLFEQLTAQALTENDIELRYRRLVATGSPARGLELLDKLDRSEQEH